MKIRTRIFLVFVLAFGAGFYALVEWIKDDLRPRYLESMEESLVDTSHLLAELVAEEMTAGGLQTQRLKDMIARVYLRKFNASIYALEKTHVDIRIYVTDKDGIVVFDSDKGRDEGRDYSRWNDVLRTLKGEYGARTTHSDPWNPFHAVLYVAAPIHLDDQLLGVLSVGKPARNVDRFLEEAKRNLIVAGITAALVASAVALILYAWVSRPLQKLVRYAQQVKKGERVALPKLGSNEIGMMGNAMEEMRAAVAGKDYAERYVQTLTHELKSPLAAIRGAAELLEEDMPAEQRRRFLANIETQTERIQELVDRMLELAAVEKRQSLDDPQSIDLQALMAKVVEDLRPLAEVKNVSIVDQLDSGVTVYGERFLIGQALTNLLRNAIEHSPEGQRVPINSEIKENNVVVHIDNHGLGIPDYALERVFERFYSLPRAGSDTKGSGLGLSFVKEVAELHGGAVALKNDGDGVSATLRLPLATQSDA